MVLSGWGQIIAPPPLYAILVPADQVGLAHARVDEEADDLVETTARNGDQGKRRGREKSKAEKDYIYE